MSERQERKLYLMLDSWSQLVARGQLENSPEADTLQMAVLDDKFEDAATHEIIQIIGIGGNDRPLKCRRVGSRNGRLLLEKLEELDPGIRQNLRVPVRFETLLYPIDGKWRGRRRVCSIDLSCGGVAFYGEPGLEAGERLEIVIPITAQPLVLRCQILRVQELQSGRTFYAAKFVDMCNDEEKNVRKAVFSIQLRDGREQYDNRESEEEATR